MAKLTKKQKLIQKELTAGRQLPVLEAIKILKKFPAKFKESLDISINLGVDPRKSEQVVRSSTNLPKGTGKTVRVAVFAQGENATKAKNAGADIVGFEDLAEKIKSGFLDFDVLIATPDAMRLVGQLGQILGPRGLMPNPKVGTVTTTPDVAVVEAKSGQVRYRTDKNGIIHCTVGKLDFESADLVENMQALIHDLKRLKPSASKGQYIKKIVISSTMGPGIPVDLSTIVL
ncbi:MAG: 50S ribosomal protein L1 [Legionellaceae bacterium]|nr:50S ribosomal protein L1 [Legionellaceae bacterium]